MRSVFRQDAHTRILDDQCHFIVALVSGDIKLPAILHCMKGIVYQIEDYRAEFAFGRNHSRSGRIKFLPD